MSKIFVTSDLHFWHKNILELSPHTRPFNSVEDMNDFLVNEWNKVVGVDDIVYNLGDVSFGNLEQTRSVLKRLNGKHYLITGNHDQVITKNISVFTQEDKHDGNKILEEVSNYKEIKYGRNTVVLFHYPICEWNKAHYGSYHLCGHIHDAKHPLESMARAMNVGFDNTNKVVVELGSLLSMLAIRPVLRRM